MKIGIIGAGHIGGTLTRRLRALGHDVTVANSRGPQTLADLAPKAAGVVKTMDGINKAAIQPHNEAADATLVIVLFSAVAALFVLIRYRGARPIAGWAIYVVAFLTILATFSSIYTSLLGGRIHHPETQMRAPR